MKNWFERLAPRERLILGTGLLAGLVIIGWGFVWQPLRANSLELRDAVGEKTRLVADLQRAEGLGSDGGAGAATSTGQSLLVLVVNTGQSSGLAFTRTRPDGSDAINVSFQNASFDNLVGWLVVLESTHGIVVERASVTESRERGLVTGQLFLRRI